MTDGYTLFDTPLGTCGIAWSPHGITHVHLPEGTARDTEARIAERAGKPRSDAPLWVTTVVDRITRSLHGAREDLSDVPLDLAGVPGFHREVLTAARAVGHGTTTTYGALARAAGSPGAARAVGQAMARNPVPLLVPCHRVLGAHGALGGFSAGGVGTKAKLLAVEGVTPPGSPAPPTPEAQERGLDYDPVTAAEVLSRSDRKLATLIERVGPVTLRADRGQSPYEALAQSIVYQQLAGAAAATIYGRVRGLFASGIFGTPTEFMALSDEKLRGAGLSGSKLLALRDLAARTLDGTVPDLQSLKALSDEAIIDRLTVIRGVGQWTVEMLLIFRLGRPDVLPAMDYGVRKGFQRVYGGHELPSPKELTARGRRWRPYRSVASWYLWRSLEQ